MIVPLIDRFAVSVVQKENNVVSLHLCHTYQDNLEYLPSDMYGNVDPMLRGVWLERPSKEEFPLQNPLVTFNTHKVIEFFSEARKWALKKLEDEARLKCKKVQKKASWIENLK